MFDDNTPYVFADNTDGVIGVKEASEILFK